VVVWSGGMADMYYVSHDGSAITEIKGDHMPLGILDPAEFDDTTQVHDLPYGGHLYSCTDGVLEARNEQGGELGDARLKTLLLETPPGRVPILTHTVRYFCGANAQRDDLSVLELHCVPLVHRNKVTLDIVELPLNAHANLLPSHFRFMLGADVLAQGHPLKDVMEHVRSVRALQFHQDTLFTILSCLVNGAINRCLIAASDPMELLGADCSRALPEGSIELSLECVPGTPNRVNITVECSVVRDDADIEDTDVLHDLCADLEYLDRGRIAKAVYAFR